MTAEPPAERTQELPRLDRVAEQDRREVQARALLLGELHELRRDLHPEVGDHVYRIAEAATLWSGIGGCRRSRRDDITMHAAELAQLPWTGMPPAHQRVMVEALTLAALVAAVVQPLGYTSQDKVI